jgi:redox-sensitive bicupin YhaK (pirin superfamily)
MSWQPANDPKPGDRFSCDAIATIIVPRSRDLGSFEVRRALPSARRQMVGPFIFFDQMGPAEFLLGAGMDVRPHPHIGLSTVTYLFDGEIMHRDSLGTVLAIRPGELNWMTAGRGIAHSERTPPELRTVGSKLFGIQSWVALSRRDEENAPNFTHYDATISQSLMAKARRHESSLDLFSARPHL